VRREVLRGLWGARVTDRLADRIVELADDPESHGDAIYFGLSTFKPKNAAVVDKLIETLNDPDWNNWDRALWGLGYGVRRRSRRRRSPRRSRSCMSPAQIRRCERHAAS
jgi:hypothetical protein